MDQHPVPIEGTPPVQVFLTEPALLLLPVVFMVPMLHEQVK